VKVQHSLRDCRRVCEVGTCFLFQDGRMIELHWQNRRSRFGEAEANTDVFLVLLVASHACQFPHTTSSPWDPRNVAVLTNTFRRLCNNARRRHQKCVLCTCDHHNRVEKRFAVSFQLQVLADAIFHHNCLDSREVNSAFLSRSLCTPNNVVTTTTV
jgi:hypothetical protein